MSEAAAAVAPTPDAAPVQDGGEGGEQDQSQGGAEPTQQAGRARDERGRFTPKPGESQEQADARGAAEVAAKAPKPADPLDRLRAKVDAQGNVTLNLHGKPVKVPLEQVPAYLEMEFAGKQRFTEADQRAKQAEATLSRLKENTDEALRAAGVDPDEWAYQRLQKYIDQQNMTPEQRAHAHQQLEFEQQRQQFEKQKQDFENQRFEQEQAALLPLFTQHVPKAMEAAGLPKTGKALDRTVEYLREATTMGEPITPDVIQRAVEAARDELREEDLAVTKDMSDEQFATWLGPERLAKVTRFQVAQYEAKRKASGVQPKEPASTQEPLASQGDLAYSEREYRLWKQSGGKQDIQAWLREFRKR